MMSRVATRQAGLALTTRPIVASSRRHSTAQWTATGHSQETLPEKHDGKERIVILGSGWAGYALGQTIKTATASRVLVSPRSHFVFTPLLASTTVGTLEFRSVIEPVRRLGLDEFHQAWASEIDFSRKTIRLEANTASDTAAGARTAMAPPPRQRRREKGPEFDIRYDKLVLAVGCYSQTFGIDGVAEHASFLRDVGDARAVRSKLLAAFERAALPSTTDAQRAQLLNFAVVGGGPTGIEFAAELHDFVHEDLAKLYPRLVGFVAITVYDIAPKVLPMFDRNLADYATELFRRQGIRVKTGHSLRSIRRDGDVLKLRVTRSDGKDDDGEVSAGLLVWSTGLAQNPLVARLLQQEDVGGVGRSIVKDERSGGIVTDAHMRVLTRRRGHGVESGDGKEEEATPLPDVYAIGDCAVQEGQRLPATAQVANQQAIWLGKQFNRGQDGDSQGPGFKFRNWGSMAYLGSQRAIHQNGAEGLKGWPAWVLWRTAYLTKSMSWSNKLRIPLQWFITWLFGRDISRF